MLSVLLQNVKLFSVAQQYFYGEFILPERIKTCSVLHVNYPRFLSDFKQIWVFSLDIHKIFYYYISRKSVQLEPL